MERGHLQAWSDWKTMRADYAEFRSDLNAVKLAFRHRAMHFRQRYDERDAIKILEKTGNFVRRRRSYCQINETILQKPGLQHRGSGESHRQIGFLLVEDLAGASVKLN